MTPAGISNFTEALAEIVGRPNLAAGEGARAFSVDGLVPAAAAFPSTCEEVASVMQLANLHGLAVTPMGGGTAIALGNAPARLDVALGMRRLDRLVEHASGDLTLTVQAGMTLRQAEDLLARHGQTTGLDAPLPERATIGGILASGTTGPRRLGYGGPRDRLIGIRVVGSSGKVTKAGGKVVKNVAGYDLNKMYVGSLGTLGIIVEATLKLAPVPPARAVLVGGFLDIGQAMAAATAVRQGWCRPVALDLLNRAAFDFVAARAGTPSMPEAQYLLVADLAGGPAAVERQKTELHRAVQDHGGKSLLVEAAAEYDGFWRALVDMGRREDVPASMITRCNVLFSQIVPLVHGHEAMAEGGRMEAAIDVHLAHGAIRASWWGEKKGPVESRVLAETARTLRIAAGHVEGTFVIESCPASVKRAIDVWGSARQDLEIMKRLKEQFDPGRLLNPGRFYGGI